MEIGADSLTLEENKIDAYNEYRNEMARKDLSAVSLNTFVYNQSNTITSQNQQPNNYRTNPQRKSLISKRKKRFH